MRKSEEDIRQLYKAIMLLKNESEIEAFFEDLCTPQELGAISQRLHVARMLEEGCVYNKIVEETGASTATISRVNKTMNYHTAGGYKLIFERAKDKK